MNKMAGNIYIQAYNGKFLCADNGCSPDVRPILANRDVPSDWERFTIVANDDGTFALRAHANGKYLSAEVDTDSRLNARADKIDAWEKFRVIKRANDGRYVLQSCANMKFVSIDSQTHQIVATADVVGEWECFNIVRCNPAGMNIEDIAAGMAGIGGIVASAVGTTMAVVGTTVVTTAGISAATITSIGAGLGGVVGGVAGGILGMGFGIAGGGIAIPATIPLATAGAVTGASVGAASTTTIASSLGIPVATTVVTATAPVWAVPLAVAGATVAVGAGAYYVLRKMRSNH